MKTQKQTTTGASVALKIAYEAVTQTIKYSHKRLHEETNLSYLTLQNIREDKLGKRSPIRNYYLPIFIELLVKEYRLRIRQGGDGATDILRVMAQILCHENYLGTLLPKEEDSN